MRAPRVGDGGRLRALAVDPRDDLARRVGRALQRRRVGVGHGERVQRRVHVARIDGDDGDAVRPELLVPDPAQVRERRLARTVRAPAGVRRDRGVARDVEHDRAAARGGAFARRAGEQAEQRLGEAERADQVGGERRLEVLALGVGEQGQRHRAEARGVVDEDVEAAERGADLQGDGVRVILAGDVADDAVAACDAACDFRDRVAVAGDEGDGVAARGEGLDQRQAEAGGAAGDGDAQRRARDERGVHESSSKSDAAKVGAAASLHQCAVRYTDAWSQSRRHERCRQPSRAQPRRPAPCALADAGGARPRRQGAALDRRRPRVGRGNPSLVVLVKVAQALGVPIDELLASPRRWCGAGRRARSRRAARAAA
jgi:hypothetical protein